MEVWKCDICDNKCIKKEECRLGEKKEGECQLMGWMFFEPIGE